jgi:hypothetical protein
MNDTPTKSVPGGCVVGLFGLFAWAYAGVCGYLLYRAFQVEDWEKKKHLIYTCSLHCGVAFIVGLILLIVGWKLAIRVGDYDAWDPKEPMMKF